MALSYGVEGLQCVIVEFPDRLHLPFSHKITCKWLLIVSNQKKESICTLKPREIKKKRVRSILQFNESEFEIQTWRTSAGLMSVIVAFLPVLTYFLKNVEATKHLHVGITIADID